MRDPTNIHADGSSDGGCCGCIGFIFVILVLIFGITITGTHYELDFFPPAIRVEETK